MNLTTQPYDVQCKVWYVNILSNLGNILNGIRRQQMLCAVDATLIERDQDCYTVVQQAAPTVSVNTTDASATSSHSSEQEELASSADLSTEQDTSKYTEYAKDLFASVKAELEEEEEEEDLGY